MLAAAALVLGTVTAASAASARQSAWHSHHVFAPALENYTPTQFNAISCTAPGSCAAGGSYTSASLGNAQSAIVDTETRGRWAAPTALVMPDSNDTKGTVQAVDCVAAGNCTAVGTSQGDGQVFAAAEVQGGWERAVLVPLPPAQGGQNYGLSQDVEGLSCRSVANCVLVGAYLTINRGTDWVMMAVTERDGLWRPATQIALPANAHTGALGAVLNSVSCARPGSCTAVGSYATKRHLIEPLVATESRGRWGRARELGLPPNSQRSFRYPQGAVANSVSCRSGDWCLAVGSYITRTGDERAFSVTLSDGRIGRPVEVSASVAGHHTNDLTSVSCTASTCLAVGTRPGQRRMMAISYARGGWRDASLISPPADAFSSPGFVLSQVSCVDGGACAAAGSYNDSDGGYDLVVSMRR